ncbi:Carbohydrate esterase 4 protein, partial [Ceratobasidium sp. 395]
MRYTIAFVASSLLGALALPTTDNTGALLRRAGAQVYSQCTKPNTVALTFDDGPWSYLNIIADTLSNAGAKGTFFFNGNNWGCIYDKNLASKVKYAYDKGHQVASHTWSHADLTTLSTDDLNSEMSKVENALKKIAGVKPAFMRPPYGNYNDNVVTVAGQRGQDLVIWDLDTEDSLGATVATSEKYYDDAIAEKPSTILALNHEVYGKLRLSDECTDISTPPVETTAKQVLPYAIQKLQAAGYQLVTVAECLGKQPYQSVGSPTPRD